MSEGLVNKAKLAEQAERYDDMAKVPKETCWLCLSKCVEREQPVLMPYLITLDCIIYGIFK